MSEMDAQPVAVVLEGVETPVRLGHRGPPLDEARVAELERELGHRLPAAYRAFLLAYNGGRLVVPWYRSGHPDDPEERLGELRQLLRLPSAPGSDDVSTYERLELPKEHRFGLPDDVLAIGDDSGGDVFVIRLSGPRAGQILILDHEEDVDLDAAPVVAEDLLEWLSRFRTVEHQAELDRLEREVERIALERGRFPKSLSRQIERSGVDRAVVERAIRRACLDVHDEKGLFTLLGDDRSRLVFDLACWLLSASRGSSGVRREDMHETMFDWMRDDDDGFGLRGFGPGAVDTWWDQRVSEGLLKAAGPATMRLGPQYAADLVAGLAAR